MEQNVFLEYKAIYTKTDQKGVCINRYQQLNETLKRQQCIFSPRCKRIFIFAGKNEKKGPNLSLLIHWVNKKLWLLPLMILFFIIQVFGKSLWSGIIKELLNSMYFINVSNYHIPITISNYHVNFSRHFNNQIARQVG